MRVTKGRRNPNFGKKLPSNPRAETCRAQVFVPHPPPLFSSWEKVPPLRGPRTGNKMGDGSPTEPQTLRTASGLTPSRGPAAAATHSESSPTSRRPGNDCATTSGRAENWAFPAAWEASKRVARVPASKEGGRWCACAESRGPGPMPPLPSLEFWLRAVILSALSTPVSRWLPHLLCPRWALKCVAWCYYRNVWEKPYINHPNTVLIPPHPPFFFPTVLSTCIKYFIPNQL